MEEIAIQSGVNAGQIALIVSSICGLIGGIISTYFVYNQKTKDKMTDLKIEQIKKENEHEFAKNNRHIAIIYGELFRLLSKLDIDRCFILQPHPDKKYRYLSVVLEVDKTGISEVKYLLSNIPMSDVGDFSKQLSTNNWLFFDDINNQVKDKKILSLMNIAGVNTIALKQLVDTQNEWIGTLVVESITPKTFDDKMIELIVSIANTIQFILPPIN